MSPCPFLVDYLVFVVWASVGAIQVGASMGRFHGLLFLHSPRAARALGVALGVGAVAWFFLSEPRNIGDVDGGLDGNVQAMGVFAGAAVAMLITLGLSSVIHARMRQIPNGEPAFDEGLDALRKSTYFRVVRESLSARWHGSPTELARFYSGDEQGVIFRLGARIVARIRVARAG